VIKVQARDNGSAEILIYEPIGADFFGSGLTARRFIADLERLGDVKDILVRINSPGGEVFDGFAIYNALKNHSAQVHVQIDGLAASIASIIAMAGDLVTMGDGAMMMIHNPWTIAIGDSEDMRKTADMLDKVSEGLLDAYESRTGIARDELKTMLAAETWLTAAEAVEKGFADERTDEGEEKEEDDDAFKNLFKKFAADFKSKSANVSPLRIAAMATQSAAADSHRKEEVTMTPEEIAAATKAAADTAARAAIQAEATRRIDIRNAFGRFADEHRDLLDTCLDDAACSADSASKKLLAKLGEGAEPLRPASVQNIADSRDKFVAGAQKAILARMGIEKPDAGNELNGRSLVDIGERCLALAGVSTRGLTKDAIARKVLAAHTTSDFPNLLSATAGKVLRKAYENRPGTWRAWAGVGQVSDFKIHPRIQMGSFNSLATIVEGGEYTYGSINEAYENAQALTKGKAILFTRQMLVNDDLGGFNRRAMLMGDAAGRSVNEDAYGSLLSAAGLGPTSTDTGTFFNATAVTTAGGHANYTSSGTAMSVASLGVGRIAMAKQKDAGLKQTLNITPAVLLTSINKEDTARTLMASETDPASSNANVPNIYRNRYAVVADPLIDAATYTNSWYLFADPSGAAAAFEVVFLDGNESPFIDDEVDFDTDALKFKVRLDYGIAIGDWRGAYRNLGA